MNDYRKDDIVWAKVKGYSFWPAVVICPDELPQVKPSGSRDVFVQFFGTGDSINIKDREHIRPILQSNCDDFWKKRSSGLLAAFEELHTYCTERKLDDILCKIPTPQPPNILLSSPAPPRRPSGEPPFTTPIESTPRTPKESSDEYEPSSGGSDDTDSESAEMLGSPELDVECHNADVQNADVRSKEVKAPTRKRQRDPSTWKRAVQRRERAATRSPKPACPDTCRFGCSKAIPQADRETLCSQYHDVSFGFDRRREFIQRCVTMPNCKRRRKRPVGPDRPLPSKKERKGTCTYSLDCYTGPDCEDGDCQGHKVCQTFFLKTLCISRQVITDSLANAQPNLVNAVSDRRGKHAPKHKLPEEFRQLMVDHINSFPRIPSHYCRASTQKEYLDSDLSITKMFQLFKEQYANLVDQNGSFPFAFCSYQHIFATNFNISFFRPKKDRCPKCAKLENLIAAGDKQVADKYKLDTYDPHIARKDAARAIKDDHNKRTMAQKSFVQATFDLQAVLPTPHCDVSLFYYKRKLNVYNFTIFNHQTRDGLCYIWPEHEGRTGSSEIGTCLLRFLSALPVSATTVSFFCDNCAGQNKNSQIAGVLVHAVRTIQHLDSVQVTYLESGHTQMEVDSMHARIEAARRHKKIYAFPMWAEIIRKARSKKDYIVGF